MKTQPNTKPKEKDAKKGNIDNKNEKIAGEGEIQTPSPGTAQSPAKIPTIIPKNIFPLLYNTGNDASMLVQRTTTVQESPPINSQQEAVKPKQILLLI